MYSVACELLDIDSSRCRDYANRLHRVPTCHELTPGSVPRYQSWLPETCAYVRLHRNEPLPSWHPLLAGTRSRMEAKGMTVSHYAVPSGTLSRRQKERHVVARWSISKLRQQQTGKAPRSRRSEQQASASSRCDRYP